MMKSGIVALCLLTVSCAIQKPNDADTPKLTNNSTVLDAQYFVNKLESLDYFKYVETSKLDEVKKSYFDSYNYIGFAGGVFDDVTGQPLDYRYYFLDGEDLFEAEGFSDKLSELEPTFNKMGFTLTVEDDVIEWDKNQGWFNQYITLNGTKYTVFHHFKGSGWGNAAKRFAEILNSELAKQDIEERIYLISAGNDGSLLFLTQEQYQLFYDLYSDSYQKPLAVNEWVNVMEIN